MNRLRNIRLTPEQLQWLMDVDYSRRIRWEAHKSTPNMIYTENRNLKIQITKNTVTGEFIVWTWE